MKISLVSGLLFLAAVQCLGQPSGKVVIAAAADLKFALDSVVTRFRAGNPNTAVDVSYGSSGKLFEQIVNGAPFHVYFSADREYPVRLKDQGRTISAVTTYGFGRIVLWTRNGSAKDMSFLLQGNVRKVSIANPLHAPYGRSAVEALKYYQIYDKVQPKLVYGENVSQAAQFVTSGAADAGIIALSLALSPTMKKLHGAYFLVPQESYKPLEQAYVVLDKARGNAAVTRFENFLKSREAKEILAYFGFSAKP